MAYTRINWEDSPSTNTPRNATNLNNMDAQIKENDEKLNGTKPMGSIVVDDVSCKNILPNEITTGTLNGVSVVRNIDGSIVLDGTATSSFNIYFLRDAYYELKAGTYTQSFNQTGIVSGSPKFIYFDQQNNQVFNIDIATENIKTLTSSSDKSIKAVSIYIPNGTNFTNFTISAQLEAGDTATTYTLHKTFDNQEVYSFAETRCGVWVDGSPLYKKTIDFGYLPNATEKTVAHNISNLGKVIKVEQHIDNGPSYTGGFVTFASYSQQTVGVNIFGNNTNIVIRTTGNESGKYAYFTLYYTKTTSGTRSIETSEEENR